MKPKASRKFDARWYSSSLLTLILVVGQWHSQILGDSYLPWIVSLGTAIVTELVLSRVLRKTWPNLLSAYISGNSVAILLKVLGPDLWPFATAAALSIASKYVLTFKDRHLWNPTNFGVCVMLVAAFGTVHILTHEWGNALFMVGVLWAIGLLTVWRARVLHVTLTYAASFVVLAWVRTWFNGQGFLTELAPVTGPMYQLYMFFMITDPRTIVVGRRNQILVTILVAVAECVIRLACDFDWVGMENPLRAAPPMFALFLVGPAAKLIDLARTSGAPVPKPAS